MEKMKYSCTVFLKNLKCETRYTNAKKVCSQLYSVRGLLKCEYTEPRWSLIYTVLLICRYTVCCI